MVGSPHTWARAWRSPCLQQAGLVLGCCGPLFWKAALPDGELPTFLKPESCQGLGRSLEEGRTSSEFFPVSGLLRIFKGKMPSPRPFPRAQVAFKWDTKKPLLSRKLLCPKS